jgi:hypothetical protein
LDCAGLKPANDNIFILWNHTTGEMVLSGKYTWVYFEVCSNRKKKNI